MQSLNLASTLKSCLDGLLIKFWTAQPLLNEITTLKDALASIEQPSDPRIFATMTSVVIDNQDASVPTNALVNAAL
jgi:hypothetical protein